MSPPVRDQKSTWRSVVRNDWFLLAVLILAWLVVIGAVPATYFEDWHWQMGSVGEWVAGLATLAAVAATLWLPRHERRLDQGRRDREAEIRDLDETRRVAYMLRLRPREFYLGENFGQIEALGTIVNATRHHSRVLSGPQAEDLVNNILATSAREDIDDLIAELTRRLHDLEGTRPS